MFKKYDLELTGQITAAEFALLIKDLYGDKFNEAQINATFKSVDKDGSGTVNFNEFIDWLHWF